MNGNSEVASVERDDVGDVTVLRLRVPTLREDEGTARLFEQAFAVVEGGRPNIVLTFDDVAFVASMALGRLVTFFQKVRSAGGRLVVCKVARPIEDMLHATRLADMLLIYPDEHEAVRSFS